MEDENRYWFRSFVDQQEPTSISEGGFDDFVKLVRSELESPALITDHHKSLLEKTTFSTSGWQLKDLETEVNPWTYNMRIDLGMLPPANFRMVKIPDTAGMTQTESWDAWLGHLGKRSKPRETITAIGNKIRLGECQNVSLGNEANIEAKRITPKMIANLIVDGGIELAAAPLSRAERQGDWKVGKYEKVELPLPPADLLPAINLLPAADEKGDTETSTPSMQDP